MTLYHSESIEITAIQIKKIIIQIVMEIVKKIKKKFQNGELNHRIK
jgi:hypothetical protein